MMKNDLNLSLRQSFSINVVLRPEHCRRAQLIGKLEAKTCENSPVALAIRESLQERNIPHSTVYAVHDDNLGSYTKLYVPAREKTFLFQAEHPIELVNVYKRGLDEYDALEFELEFLPIGEVSEPNFTQFRGKALLHLVYNWIAKRASVLRIGKR